ncbi:MAG: LPS assembly lipoprotein LptE [Paludibacteraceae bacterium]|nr:LPS assembly lipoprotein LptE [Paludibacteraceae bacterium]
MLRIRNFRSICFYLCILLVCSACAIRYSCNGASIDYTTTRSISIADFPNNAALVYPQLSSDLSEGIRDLFSRQTRLAILRKGGDLELEGEIINYALTPMSVSADSYAAETKLTVTVRVRFTSNVNPQDSFERTYSAYQTFDATKLLTDVQEELCATMIEEISQAIFNDTVAKW